MTIIEAINQRSKRNGLYITRKAWGYPYESHRGITGPAVKLMPTDSPDGFVIVSKPSMKASPGWKPGKGDIIADDWITVF